MIQRQGSRTAARSIKSPAEAGPRLLATRSAYRAVEALRKASMIFEMRLTLAVTPKPNLIGGAKASRRRRNTPIRQRKAPPKRGQVVHMSAYEA